MICTTTYAIIIIAMFQECAKGVGEPCGGFHPYSKGSCAPGLMQALHIHILFTNYDNTQHIVSFSCSDGVCVGQGMNHNLFSTNTVVCSTGRGENLVYLLFFSSSSLILQISKLKINFQTNLRMLRSAAITLLILRLGHFLRQRKLYWNTFGIHYGEFTSVRMRYTMTIC